MGRIYFKELPLFHLYDSDLTGTQKLLMTLLLVNQFDIYDLSCLAQMRPGGRGRRSGGAETEGVSARQVKSERNLRGGRKDFCETALLGTAHRLHGCAWGCTV